MKLNVTLRHVQKPGSLFAAAPALSVCGAAQSLCSCRSAQCGSGPGTYGSSVATVHLSRCAGRPPEA